MKTVCMLGRNGFIGKTVLKILEEEFLIVPEPEVCDVLVNCAGYSRMYLAKRNPNEMQSVEDMIFDRVQHIQFKRLIHLSSIHVTAYPNEPYSLIKKETERKLLSKYDDVSILRIGSVLGEDLQKNAIYDLVHDTPLWVTSDSSYTFISKEDIGNIIAVLIENPIEGVMDVGGIGAISISECAKFMRKNPSYGSIQHIISMNVSKLLKLYKVKTSREYVEEYWRSTLC